MDDSRFDTLTRSFTGTRSRRGALGALLGGTLGSLGMVTEARKKKKKKKKKRPVPTSPPPCVPTCSNKACGSDGCSGSCGPCNGGTCTNGACLCPDGDVNCEGTCIPSTAKCCYSGLNCRNDATERCIDQQCVVWQGTCTTNADRCIDNNFGCTGPNGGLPGSCYTAVSGETRCGESGLGSVEQCGECQSDDDCVAYGVGAFCAKSTGTHCTTGCPIGTTFCRRPPDNA